MATLREISEFTTPVYLVERTDPYTGGEFGSANRQARELANRTRYLLDRILLEHELDGKHTLTEAQVAEAAAIVESKLALDVGTADLYSSIAESEELLSSVAIALDSIQNLESSKFKYVYYALMLSWRYGFPRFAFELFTRNFTFADNFQAVDVIETIAGDDSIDVTDTSGVEVNGTYVIWDSESGNCKPVTVKKILSDKRLVLYADEQLSRVEGVLTKNTWTIDNGAAIAKAGSMYITKPLNQLTGKDKGNLVIAHYSDASFTVEYQYHNTQNPTVWLPTALIKHGYSDDIEMWRSVFETPGGEFVLRITCNDDAVIPHMSLMSDAVTNMDTTVRTPKIADQDFTVVRFGAIYDAKHTGTIFELSKDADFTHNTTLITFGASTNVNPLWEYRDRILNRYSMAIGDDVYWRVRYTASDGYQSKWSEIGHYVREAL
jgi:hypothetical protein